jgi:DNA-binding LytR/AlgR family response regulator
MENQKTGKGVKRMAELYRIPAEEVEYIEDEQGNVTVRLGDETYFISADEENAEELRREFALLVCLLKECN